MIDSFDSVKDAAKTGGPEAVFQVLAEKFRSEKNYAGLFEVRLMEKRRELALPLLQMGSLDDLPEDKRPDYERAFIDIARDTGNLFLADGDIARGFSYLPALGETR